MLARVGINESVLLLCHRNGGGRAADAMRSLIGSQEGERFFFLGKQTTSKADQNWVRVLTDP